MIEEFHNIGGNYAIVENDKGLFIRRIFFPSLNSEIVFKGWFTKEERPLKVGDYIAQDLVRFIGSFKECFLTLNDKKKMKSIMRSSKIKKYERRVVGIKDTPNDIDKEVFANKSKTQVRLMFMFTTLFVGMGFVVATRFFNCLWVKHRGNLTLEMINTKEFKSPEELDIYSLYSKVFVSDTTPKKLEDLTVVELVEMKNEELSFEDYQSAQEIEKIIQSK